MDSQKSHPNSTNNTESTLHQVVEQIPNRSVSNRLSSHLIPPVTTHRTLHQDEELNKNISSDYQEIQIRTLTKWINVQLKEVDDHISSIAKDLKDGKRLLKLLSVVANNPLLKPERGSMRIHQLSNVAQALKFLQEQWGADSLPAVASEAIVNGDVKSTLAITFFIMLKYQIHPILINHQTELDIKDNLKVPPPSPVPSVSASRSGTTKPMAEAKLALLYWVRSQLSDYIQHRIINGIQDFSRSWRSGLAFCLLIHRHDPDLIPTLFQQDYLDNLGSKETWETLLSMAFDIAESSLNVPKYLEPEDLIDVEYPHEPSVMMYVSEMYKVMNSTTHLNDIEEKLEKRMLDISLVKTHDDNITPPPDELIAETKEGEQQVMMKKTENNNDNNDEVPGTPQPEVLITTEDVHEQLDTLSSLLSSSSTEEKEIEQQLKDNKKSQILLDQAHEIILKLSPSSSEKQVLATRYNQLKAEWELLSKRLEEIQYNSNYTNESNKITVHPLDGLINDSSDIIQTAENTLDKIPSNQVDTIRQIQLDLNLFKRGITFRQITTAIRDELDVVQQVMSNSGVNKSIVTDDLIQSLEQRIHIVNTSIQGIREEFQDDLLRYDTSDYFDRFVNLLDDLEDHYETVRDWVYQVRVWFVEAERIRTWIDQQIRIIEDRNDSDTFNPISRDLTLEDQRVMEIHQEHERLKQDIEHFDSDDMNRLRAHVKMLTQNATTSEDIFHKSDRHDLSPADTSTIEITLTTLNMLNQLTHLLSKRTRRVDLLLLRVKWEALFGQAVNWIAKTDGELGEFLRGKARWSEKEEANYEQEDNEQGIESVIKTLVSLERKIADFDHGDYSNVLDAYQEMESLETLPDYLEVRQLGFEKCFEDLMKRSGFSRKVVEQLLSMMNTVSKFKELRDAGERLRHHLLQEAHVDEDVYTEQVQLFKEESARLITNAETAIPFPPVPEMSTAIGANDAQDNQLTNEHIKSTISAYSMSLALIADGLDQLLMSRYQVMSLQQRTQESYDAMKRVRSWMEERIKLLNKSRFDLLLYTSTSHNTTNGGISSSTTTTTSPSLADESKQIVSNFETPDEENLLRLEKERDGIASRLEQMENDELSKLFETVRILEYDVDASNAVSIDRDRLINGLESLERTHAELKELIVTRGIELEVLKKRLDWETQWSKSNSHLHTIGRKLSDFNIKKARFDPAKENVEKPSYANDHENMQSLQFIQDRLTELGDRHILSLSETYQDLVESYGALNATVPDLIVSKQNDLKLEFDDLKLLSTYTLDLMNQRSTITEFLLRVQDAHHEGDKIKDVVLKKTRRINVKEDENNNTSLEEHILAFKQEITSIWEECGKTMIYPVYNGNWLRSPSFLSETAGLYRSQVRAQIKSLLDKKMEELRALEKSIDQLLSVYDDANRMKSLVTQYEQEACELGRWIEQQIESLKRQHLDVSAESFLERGLHIDELKKSRLDLFLQVESFESDKLKTLHDQIAQLVQDSVEKKKNQSVDVSSAARHLGEVMDRLSQLKRGLSDQAVTLEAASMRSSWESSLQLGITKLEEMNEQLRQFTTKKNQWISLDELSEDHVHDLQQDLNKLIQQKNRFEKSILPGIQLNYDTFVEYFPKLSRPMATPDHLEARMESLGRTSLRFQETVSARSKELELLKQKIKWEDLVKQALLYLFETEIKIEHFVEEKARWHSTETDLDQDDESILRTELAQFYTDFETYQEKMFRPIKSKFDTLVNESNDQYNNTSPLSNTFVKKMQDVVSAQDRHQYYLDFSNEVVTQRCLVAAFILRTAQLEQSAELIREEFIATKVHGAVHIASLLEEHTDRLDKFKAGIEDVRDNLATRIPYPVRTLENISTQAKLRDETTNSVIQETIEMRNTRLDEICSGLQQLLESKERVSRRRLSLHSYKKQAQVAEAWIGSRQEILNRSNSIKKENKVDIERLKEAVSQADSVEQAMKSNESVFTSLNTTFDKCITAFQDKSLDQEEVHDEGHHELVQEVESIVEPTQKRLSQAWNTLLLEAAETTKHATALLIENKIQAWLSCLVQLDARIVSDTNEEQLDAWDEELNKLETQEYQHLLVDVESNKSLLNQDQITSFDSLFKTGVETMASMRDKITELQDKLHLGRLIEKYLLDLSQWLQSIQGYSDQLSKMLETYSQVQPEFTAAEARENQYQALVTEYKQVSDTVTDLKDVQGDVVAQYNTILAQDATFTENAPDSNKWETLVSFENSVAALVSRCSRWVKHFNALSLIRKDLLQIQATLSKSGLTSVEYKQVEESLNEIDVSLTGDLFTLVEELSQDTVNAAPFENQRAECIQLKDQLKLDLNRQVTEIEKTRLIDHVQSVVRSLCDSSQAQLDIANQHISSVGFTDPIQVTIDACSTITSKNSSVYDGVQNELDALRLNQCVALVKLGCTEQEVNGLIEPVLTVLDQLQQTTLSEKECLSLANLVSQYTVSESTLLEHMDTYTSKSLDNTMTQETMLDLEAHLESLEENKKELTVMGSGITEYEFKYLLESEARKKYLLVFVQASQEKVEGLYQALVDKLQKTRMEMEQVKKRQNIITKLNDLILLISDMTDRVNALQLQGTGSEEKEFDELCRDFYQTLDKKTKTLNPLLTAYESDKEINQLQQKLKNDTDALHVLLSIKKKQASDEGDLSEFLELMTEFDEQIEIVLAAIENASPHHSGMVNNKFVKQDLQALLRSLVAVYKKHQISINKTLDRATVESKKQFLGDNERVATLLLKAVKKWTQVQAAAAARERELQTCIGKLDHEFFTKLAMAKSTPRKTTTTTRNSLHPPPAAASPTVKRYPPSSPSGRYFSPFPRRSVDETNKHKISISASSSASRLSRTSYVPDPRNALDIELSHIVNASPYRITVKIVPDQVGKYWFGDENPRLVYCRILPSQLVMVRVGGGWVELSKFLREHGLTEGISSRPSSSNDNNTTSQQEAPPPPPPFQEGYLQTFRSSSPTGRVTIRGGGANSSSLASTRSSSKSSGSRSRSPLPGFVDGDKYISVDEAGNHVVVKMKKANNDAKMPIIKKKQ